ncbi:hypothetical protein ACFY2V_28870 [Streptomyces eurythermus]|uniref:hypothetical protein n=1 Tax=Streptomyces eurythermus TaxID=42237 RepID=UPI0036C1E707
MGSCASPSPTTGRSCWEAHTLLSGEEVCRILVRDTPRPRTAGAEAWRWLRRHRLRNALSRWYFGRSVELPATAGQRRRAYVRAAPGESPEDEAAKAVSEKETP